MHSAAGNWMPNWRPFETFTWKFQVVTSPVVERYRSLLNSVQSANRLPLNAYTNADLRLSSTLIIEHCQLWSFKNYTVESPATDQSPKSLVLCVCCVCLFYSKHQLNSTCSRLIAFRRFELQTEFLNAQRASSRMQSTTLLNKVCCVAFVVHN